MIGFSAILWFWTIVIVVWISRSTCNVVLWPNDRKIETLCQINMWTVNIVCVVMHHAVDEHYFMSREGIFADSGHVLKSWLIKLV